MNEQKFSGKGGVYAKARPCYPNELFEYLTEHSALGSGTVAADIGSGTGIFTRRLAEFAEKVYAVEPNDDMRRSAEEKYADCGNIISVNGNAEHSTLPDGSVSLVTAAQAFHWFDRTAFKAECRRILGGEGFVCLVWNDRDASSGVIADNFAVNSKFCPNFKGSSNGFDFGGAVFDEFFDGKYEKAEFRNDLVYDLDGFIARNLSSSYTPKPSDASCNAYCEALKEVFAAHAENGLVKYPYITVCYLGRV